MEENLAQIYPNLSSSSLKKWLVTPPCATFLRTNNVPREELVKRIAKICTSARVEAHETLPDVVTVVTKNEDSTTEELMASSSVVVGSGCATSVMRGAEIYAPGIMGASPALGKGDVVQVYADLSNKLLKGSVKFCLDEYIYVGQGVALLSRADLFKEGIQTGLAIKMTSVCSKCPRVSDDHLSSLRELYFMQNLPSILTVHQLDIAPDDQCLDMCAAPGGKTTHIASLLGPNGRVLAFDKSQSKINQILQTAERLKVSDKIQATVQDATKAELAKDSFDKVLLDAPCSALGQRPMLVQAAKAKELRSFAKLQKKLFDKAVQVLKPGGFLVYSTCTITIDENEGMVKWALDKFKSEIELCATKPILGQPGHDLGPLAEKVQRFGPGNESTIGFFIAKFRKM